MGPVGSRFLGPVLIEVPHVASLRHGERETAILRCDSASRGKWVEHPQEDFMEKILKVFIRIATYLAIVWNKLKIDPVFPGVLG